MLIVRILQTIGLFSLSKVSSETDGFSSVDTSCSTKFLPLLQVFHSNLKIVFDHNRILASYDILLWILNETFFNDVIDEGNYLTLKAWWRREHYLDDCFQKLLAGRYFTWTCKILAHVFPGSDTKHKHSIYQKASGYFWCNQKLF